MQPDKLFDFLAKNRKFVAAWSLFAVLLVIARLSGVVVSQDATVQLLWWIAVLGGLGCGCLVAMDVGWWLTGEIRVRLARRAEAKQADAIALANLRDCERRSAGCLMYIAHGMQRQRFIAPAHNRYLQTLVDLKLVQQDGPFLHDGNIAYRVRDNIWTALREGARPASWGNVRVPNEPPWIDRPRY